LPIGEYDVDRRDGALAYVLDGETTDAPCTLMYVDAEGLPAAGDVDCATALALFDAEAVRKP
jgi:hypothetical protein